MFFMSGGASEGPLNNDGPLFDLINELKSSSSSDDKFNLNIDVIDQFNDDFNIQTRFIPHPFPNSDIKSKFLKLLFKYLQDSNNNLESALNVLRLLLREYDGLHSILTIDFIDFISKLLLKYIFKTDLSESVSETSISTIRNCTFKCLLNLIHHSSELRIWLCNNEEFKSKLNLIVESIFEKENFEEFFLFTRLLFYMTFERENAKLFISENINILLLVIEKAVHYFSNWIENSLNKYSTIYSEKFELENPEKVIEMERNLNISSNLFKFPPFFLSFIEDLFKSSYCLSVHLQKDELQQVINCFKPLVQKSLYLFTSLSVHINIRSSSLYKESTTTTATTEQGFENDSDLLYQMIHFKSQLKTLMKHTIQNLTEFSPLEKKEILCIFNENQILIPNKAILYALLSEYINYNIDSDLYTDYLIPIIGILQSCVNFSDEETPTLGSEFRMILCDWIFENTNWILNTPPHIPDYVQEYIQERIYKKTTKFSNQQDENEENEENQDKIDPLDAQDLSTKPIKCLFIGRMSDYNYNFKTIICQFLFKLCSDDVNVFSQICGPGNTLGYLAEKGLLGNLLNQQEEE